jgi:hypothetical protein
MICDGCQIHGPMPFALCVTETPVEVKALMDTTPQGELVEAHAKTGASVYFDAEKVTALAGLWKEVEVG